MKRVLAAFAAMLCLAGCYPAFRTVQPRLKVVVMDPAGRPVENATFTLVTYREPMGARPKLTRYQTDSAGALFIPRRGQWQMEILLPDGSSWYSWGYCVEKAGYRAIAVPWKELKSPLKIVLEPRSGSSQCKWAREGEDYRDVTVVEDAP
jgi:hypothetical protein